MPGNAAGLQHAWPVRAAMDWLVPRVCQDGTVVHSFTYIMLEELHADETWITKGGTSIGKCSCQHCVEAQTQGSSKMEQSVVTVKQPRLFSKLFFILGLTTC